MSIELRPVRPADAAALAAFYNGLSEASKRTFRPIGVTTTAEKCSEMIGQNAPEVAKKHDIVACDGPNIVGWGFLWDLHAGAPTLGLGVADAYQGRGLGSALMDRLLAFAVQQKIRHVKLTVVQDNEKAWRMYERRGFINEESMVGSDGLPYFYMVADLSDRIAEAERPPAPGP